MHTKAGNRRVPEKLIVLVATGLLLATPALCGTFGRVVAIGGHASDLVLDEPRNVLYVANYTANRIEVMSLGDGSIQTSLNVSSQPSSLALSPDGKYLLVGHYGNFAAPNAPTNALTVIDLNTRARQTFALGNAALGVSFGIDDRALVVTTTEFLLFDPVTGVSTVLSTISDLVAKTLPQPPSSFPPNIVAASVAGSGDRRYIYGLTDTFTFSYEVERKQLAIRGYTSSPPMGPRVVAVNQDGSYFLSGWVLRNRAGRNLAQFPDPAGLLNVGSHAIDSERGIAYSQVGQGSAAATAAPVLQVVDTDNLRVRNRLQLAENLAGKSALSSDGSTMYAISDSGVTILPVGQLDQSPQVFASTEDLVFRGNFCDRRVASQEIAILSSGGSPTDFVLTASAPGITITPSRGVTPATVRISVDPATYQNVKGTIGVQLNIASAAAVNVTKPVRVLINNREPDQRGTFVNVPGKLVDVLADPVRDRFFVLRQDTNEVYVYDGRSYQHIKTLRTGNTPTQLAVTFDRRWLIVGNDNSQIANVFDLETLEASEPIYFPGGHYPRSIASSGNALLAAIRVAGEIHVIDRVDMATRTASQLPTLGVYENNVNINTMLIASPSGSSILAAQADGNVLLYNANVDTFTISRKDTTELGGAYAASSFDQFVVGDRLMNSSLVTVRTFESNTGRSSGFAFVGSTGFRTTAPDASSPGVIQRVDATNGASSRPTRMAEAPLLGSLGAAFTRTVAPLYSRNAVIALTTSGFTVLPWEYDAAVAAPRLTRVLNAADNSTGLSPGGLMSLYGNDLSPVNLASRELPLPTALGESCLTVNGIPTPILFVSPSQINAQMPFNVEGNVTMILRTPGGVSDNYNLTVRSTAPGVFRATIDGNNDIPTVVRAENNEVVTLTNPIRRNDGLVIMLTGLGITNPAIDAGIPAPADPPLTSLVQPTVTLGGTALQITFAGLSAGQVGVYQINAKVPNIIPTGVEVPLTIDAGGASTTLSVRVVN